MSQQSVLGSIYGKSQQDRSQAAADASAGGSQRGASRLSATGTQIRERSRRTGTYSNRSHAVAEKG